MTLLHLHLLSDSTGETLEMIAKAALAQFDDAEVIRHFWPMVRSLHHLDRIVEDLSANPGLVLYTLVNDETRRRLEERCRALGLPHVAPLDSVTGALEDRFGVEAKARPGRQHMMDDAYFARVDAIQFTIAHDDGIAWEDWEQADILLAGVSRSSKTPTSIYLANRGYKVANIPLVIESPPPPLLFQLTRPMVVGLTTAPRWRIAAARWACRRWRRSTRSTTRCRCCSASRPRRARAVSTCSTPPISRASTRSSSPSRTTTGSRTRTGRRPISSLPG